MNGKFCKLKNNNLSKKIIFSLLIFCVCTIIILFQKSGKDNLKIEKIEIAKKELQQTTVPDGYTGIYTIDDLFAINDALSGDYILMQDIDASGVDWKIIGTSSSSAFKGTLDGNYYKIKNINIDSTEANVGFFGYVNSATIQNLTLENVKVSSTVTNSTKRYIGTLVGQLRGTTIENVHITGESKVNVQSESTSGTATINVGGYVGYIYNTTINNASSSTEVNSNVIGENYVGGFSGYSYAYGKTLTDIYATGNVYGKSAEDTAYVGGLIGYAAYGAILEKGYSEGNVKGETDSKSLYIGGLIGTGVGKTTSSRLSVKQSYSISNVEAISKSGTIYSGGLIGYASSAVNLSSATYSQTYGFIGNTFALGNCVCTSDSGQINAGALIGYTSMSTNNYVSVQYSYSISNVTVSTNGKQNISGIVGCAVENSVKVLRCYWSPETTQIIKMSDYGLGKQFQGMLYQENYINWDFDTIWAIDEGKGLPYLKAIKKPNVLAGNYEYTEYEGKGLETNPYIITNQEQLEAIEYELKGTYYKLGNDIDITEEFNMIGNESGTYFSGVLDGQNYTIKNLNIQSSNEKIGLFAWCRDATLKNINFEDAKILVVSPTSESSNIGMLIGMSQNDTIENINILGESTIQTSNCENALAIGGIIGDASGLTSNNVTSTAEIKAKSQGTLNVGGIIGYADSVQSSITNAKNVGITECNTTSGNIYVGGVVGAGRNAKLDEVSSTGDILAISETGDIRAGGIVSVLNEGSLTWGIAKSDIYLKTSGYACAGGAVSQMVQASYESPISVSKTYSTGDIYVVADESATVGGLIGTATSSAIGQSDVAGAVYGIIVTVSNSFSTSRVEAKSNGTVIAGGLIGSASISAYTTSNAADMTITNTYAVGEVIANTTDTINEGGLVGYKYTNTNNASVVTSNSYWAPETTGEDTSKSGTAKTINELLYQEAYNNWNFDTIWTIEPNGGSLAYLRDLEKPEGINAEDLLYDNKLSIIKTDKEGNRLKGAEFSLKDSNGEVVENGTTDLTGVTNVYNLSLGTTYTLEEIEAPYAYKRITEPYTFTYTGEQTEIVLENEPMYIVLKNQDVDTKEPLQGAQITVYNLDGDIAYAKDGTKLVGQTNELGEINFTNLLLGTYKYKQTTVVSGYVIDENVYTVTIDDDGQVDYGNNEGIIYNEKIKLDVIITKKAKETEKLLSGAKIGLYNAEGIAITEDNVHIVRTTNASGEATFEKLVPGTYKYKEIEPPIGYVLNNEMYEFTIETDGTLTYGENGGVIYNERIKVNVAITKQDKETKEVLSGASITLYNSSGTSIETKTTDANGQVVFENLEPGTYQYKETSAPTGYFLNSIMCEFTVNEDGTVTHGENNGVIYNEKITANVTITKYRTGTTQMLAGATIALKNESGTIIETKTTGTSGTVTFENLEPGTYQYTETKAPTGYVLNNATYEFTIDEEGNVTHGENEGKIYNDRIKAKVTITKKDKDTNEVLSGASITLYNSVGTSIETKTTSTDGTVTFENLEPGTYQYTETKAPTGYVLNNTTYEFTIDEEGNVTHDENEGIIYNDRITADVTITKYRTETTQKLSGATITLYNANQVEIESKTTGENGTVIFEDLIPGTYKYKETKAPTGYVLNNTTYEFTIDEEGNVTYGENEGKIYNDRIKAKVTITKKAKETQEVLSGASITLYNSVGTSIETKTTGENGQETFEDLEPGTYKYKEITAPTGYVLNDTMYEFTIDEEGNITHGENNGVIYNERITADITITKKDKDTKEVLSGANITLYNSAGTSIESKTTGENGQVTFLDLEPGTYKYKETNAPTGYVLNDTMYEFTINEDGTVTYGENEGVIYNERITKDVTITKKDKDTNEVLSGATIGLYDAEGNEILLGEEHAKGTTADLGIIIFRGLKPGKYKYKEIVAPTGYVLNDTMYEFTVNEDGTVTYGENNGVIYNEKIKVDVTITKYRTETTQTLSGATIALYNANQVEIESKTTGENGQVTFENLIPGTYKYKETKAPTGYVLNSTMYEFTIDEEGNITHGENGGVIYNDRITADITITKKDKDTNEVLSGASITLYNSSVTSIETKTTGEIGQVTFENLDPGTYKYKEIAAPTGYVLNDTMYEFTIDEEGNITYGENGGIIYNERITKDVTITKKDKDTNEVLSGATIGLYDAEGNEILLGEEHAKGTTADLGIIIFRGLKPGTYKYKEIVAPTGYVLNDTMYEFTVNEDGTVTYGENNGVIYNDRIKVDVTITKKAHETEEVLPGATIELYDSKNEKNTTKTTGENGQVTFEDLTPGTYKYKEIEAPLGYVLNNAIYEFTIAEDGSITHGENEGVIYNERIKSAAIITKKDVKTEIVLPGARISLYNSEEINIETKTTDENGQVVFENLEPGTYKYKEIEAPLGYVLNNTIYEFTIAEDGTITYGENNGVIYNEKITATAVITKKEKDTNKLLPGASISLYNSEEISIETKTTNENGQVIFENLEPGVYKYQEIEAPLGYVLNNTIYEFTIAEDGTVTYGENNGVIYNEKIKVDVTIIKKDKDTGALLQGAEIELYDLEEKIIASKTTNANGQVIFEDLEPGTYKYKETKAPLGYVLNSTMYEFTVNEDGTVTYGENNGVIYNEKIVVEEEIEADVTITKKDKETNETLEGATIVLYNESGEELGKQITGKDGKVTFENLKPGKYQYKEDVAPVGYNLNSTMYQFTVNEDASITHGENNGIIYNEKIKTVITIANKDKADGKLLSGAVVKIYNEAGEEIAETTIGENGQITVDGLEPGVYKYKEVKAPIGYKLNSELHSFTIAEDGSVDYTENEGVIYNEKIKVDVTITKKDEDNDKLLSGATIILYDKDGNELKRETTNESGKVTFTELEIGTIYYYKEEVAPTGYNLNSTKYKVQIDELGNITYEENDGVIYNRKILIQEENKNDTKLPQTGQDIIRRIVLISLISASMGSAIFYMKKIIK